MTDGYQASAGEPSGLRKVSRVVLLTLLASAMLFLEGYFCLFPREPLLVILLLFALLSFGFLSGAKSLDAAFGRACFLFAGLWLWLYPATSYFFLRYSILSGGQEVVVPRPTKFERLTEGVYLEVMEWLATGWFPAVMAGLCVVLGVYRLRSSRVKAEREAEQTALMP